MIHGRMLIGGELVEAMNGERLQSVNPATEEPIGSVPAAGAADIEAAVSAARQAAPGWAAASPKERAAVVRKLAAALRDRAEALLEVEVKDTGNTISKMRGDVASAGDALEYYAGLGLEIKGQTIPASARKIGAHV